MIELLLKEISDSYVRENFRRLQDHVRTNSLFEEFRSIDISVPSATDHLEHLHGLGFVPLDVVITSAQGSGQTTFHYDQFDKNNLVLSTTGPVKLRALVGTFRRGRSAT